MLAAIFLLVLYLASCKKQEHGTGVGLYSDNNQLGIHFVDTFEINSYSKIEDSAFSSGSGIGNLGFYKDPFFGNTKAGFYTQFEIGGSGAEFGDTLNCDSIVLYLKLGYNQTQFFGAENKPMRVDVNLISKSADFQKDSSYYTSSVLPLNRESLVDPEFNNLILPNFTDTVNLSRDSNITVLKETGVLRIRLKKSFGQKLLDLEGTSVLENNDNFLEEFKGLKVSVVDNEGESIVFLDMDNFATTLMLYYKEGSDQSITDYKFVIDNVSAHFNYYEHDYLQSGSLRLKASLLDSTIGNEYISLQSGGGFKSYINFPDLLDLKETQVFIPINRAELILPIEEGSAKSFAPPPQLFIFMINDEGKEELVLDQYLGTSHIDGIYDQENNQYRFNLVKQIQAIMNDEVSLNGFVLKTANPGSSPNRVILNGNAADTSMGARPMSLRLYYSSLIN